MERRAAECSLQLQEASIKRARTLLESPVWNDLSPLVDLVNRFNDREPYLFPFSQPTDRLYGANWPFWRTEQELAFHRGLSRLLCATNTACRGLLRGLTSFVVNQGFTYRIVAKGKADGADGGAKRPPQGMIAAGQAVLDRFAKENRWHALEKELYRRRRRDGEFFLRLFSDEYPLRARTIEPDQVMQPPGSDPREWSFGVQCPTDPVDTTTALAYAVRYEPALPMEEVPAEDVIHHKNEVDSAIKRGMPDFVYEVRESLAGSGKLLDCLGKGGAVQASIAAVEQFETASKTQIQQMVDGLTDATKIDPVSGRQTPTMRTQPGTIYRVPKGQQFVAPPAWSNAEALLAIDQALVRRACVIYNAPEWLASSDASNNNYASSLTAESPFVIFVQGEQREHSEMCREVMIRALRCAIDHGELPADFFEFCDVQVETPSPMARDRLQEAQVYEIEKRNNVTSAKTWQMKVGRDPDEENVNLEEERERFGPQPGPSGGLGGMGGLMGGMPPQLGEGWMREDAGWDEDKHKRRSDGKFGSGGGGSGGGISPAAVSKATETWAAKAKELPAKAWTAAKAKVGQKYAQLESRYGRKYAIAIMGAGLAGLPLPVPGSSLLTAAPVIAVAELHKRLSGRTSEAEEMDARLSPEEIERLGKAWIKSLLAAEEGESDEQQTTGYTCGPVALLSAMRMLGVAGGSEEELAKAMGATPESGVAPAAIVAVAKRRGLQAAGEQLSLDRLAELTAAGRVVICPIQSGEAGEEQALQAGHYVAVFAADATQVRFADPAEGADVKMPAAEFERRWLDRDGDGSTYIRYGIVLAARK